MQKAATAFPRCPVPLSIREITEIVSSHFAANPPQLQGRSYVLLLPPDADPVGVGPHPELSWGQLRGAALGAGAHMEVILDSVRNRVFPRPRLRRSYA
jgi:hypothetical protein